MKAEWFKVTIPSAIRKPGEPDTSCAVLVIDGRLAVHSRGFLPGDVGDVWQALCAQVESWGWLVDRLHGS